MEGKIFFIKNSENKQKQVKLLPSNKITNNLPPRRGDIKIRIFKSIAKTIASTPPCGGNGGCCRRRFRSLPVTPVEEIGGGSGAVVEEETRLAKYYVATKSSVCPKRGDVKMKIFKGIFHAIVSIISTPCEYEVGRDGDNEIIKKVAKKKPF